MAVSTPRDNTRGLGVVLRFASAIVPPVTCFLMLLLVEERQYGESATPDLFHNVFRVIAFVWAWPYAMYDQQPLSFGLLALLAIVLSVVLLVRRDWRGAVTVFLWCLFWGWLLAAIIGQTQGT